MKCFEDGTWKVRAWSVIEYKLEAYIIIEFIGVTDEFTFLDLSDGEVLVKLTRFELEVKRGAQLDMVRVVRENVYKFYSQESTLVPEIELRDCEVLFCW